MWSTTRGSSRPRCVFTTAEQLAERIADEAADVVVVESDSISGPVFELGLRAIASTRGDPNNVDVAGATAAGIPVLHTPGRNADAVAEMTLALLFAATRQVLGADADVRGRRDLPQRQHSVSALPRVGSRRPNSRADRPRRRRAGSAVADGRARHASHRL